MPDPAAVKTMFGRIARRYDLANRLLSGGSDVWWRWRLVRRVRRAAPADVLDLATGSGDVAFALAQALPPATRITGMDFCLPMLDEATAKQRAFTARAPVSSTTPDSPVARIEFRQGDGMDLPLDDECMDAVTISFGLRNMASRLQALREMHRVLRPGGRVHVLEFSQPWRWFRPVYFFYLKHLLPRIARIVTGDKSAYDYLCGSIETYPTHTAMSNELRMAGFKDIEVLRMTFGIVALHTGRRGE
ncbi:ubiquinone/menaquinone biosynthesis methyltransferase [Geminisphaera colitermitum]|uniref:ubiquinone/menaquinone biosynthesis methyltransferase n=1 Tax=Geminisphaera colitermitum TaxID=1148786 RepID=UPI000158C739|nr:ubiquinone/menaquinone biosynthesis methyltransferase [Geminisphaera colitermitum]